MNGNHFHQEDEEVINPNPLINNNDNNDNNNNNVPINNNNLNQNNNEENNNDPRKKYLSITLSFIFILIINTILIIYSFFQSIDESKYIFQFEPIKSHNQYYRFITRYFIHFSICHILLELYFAYFIFRFCENVFGTIITLSFMIISFILTSFLQFIIIIILHTICQIFNIKSNYYLDYEGGLTPILFAMNTFYFSFNLTDSELISFMTFFLCKRKYISFIFLFVLFIATPNHNSLLGNICGILSAYFIKKYYWLLPRAKWIIDFEETLCPKDKNYIYRQITKENVFMGKFFKEFEKSSLDELINKKIICKEDEEGGENNKVIEMSNIENKRI